VAGRPAAQVDVMYNGFRRILETRCIVLIAVILVSVMSVRASLSGFWTDECYTIHAINLSYTEILNYLINADAHPPVYYYFTKALCDVFGYTPFVFHMSAFIPYVLVVIADLTLVRKTFGNEICLTVLICASLLTSSFSNIMEVRMYELALFFMVLFAVFAYRVQTSEDTCALTPNSIILGFVSIFASYTHIFCAIGIGMFLVCMLVTSYRWRRGIFKQVLVSFLIFAAACFPVAIYAASRFDRFPEDFWIVGFPPVWVILGYLFGKKEFVFISAVFAVLLGLFLFREFTGKTNRWTDMLEERTGERPSQDGIFALLCILSILLTILLSYIVTVTVRPVFSTRYLYPLSIFVWLTLGISIMRYREKMKILAAVLLTIIVVSVPMNVYDTMKEIDMEEETEETLDATEFIGPGDYVIDEATNPVIVEYYYGIPLEDIADVKYGQFTTDYIREGCENWLFLYFHIDQKTIDALSAAGYGYETVLEDGHLNKYRVNIYRIV